MRYENKMDMNGDNMNLFKNQIILYVLLYGGIICTAIGVAGEPDIPLQAILIIAGVLFFIAAAIYLFWKYRCPWCHCTYPWGLSMSTEYCPYCGDKIE